MSNYPDNVDFSRMSWEHRETAEEREAAQERYEARTDLIKRATAIGTALVGTGIERSQIACISEAICEELISVRYYEAILSNGPAVDGYDLAHEAMLKAAFPQTEGKAA